MVESCPVPSITNLNRWEIDRVKVHVVLSHELVQVNVLGVEPPLLPLGCEIRGDANITYTGFKLDTVRSCVSWRNDANLPIHLERSHQTVKVD
jgi:hypothetical protein